MKDGSHCTKKVLKDRGWNDKLIEQLLGEPDDTAANTYYRSGPPVCLYDVDRVHALESTKEFQEVQQSRLKRREAAQNAVATKKKKLQQFLEGIEVKVPEMEWEVLTRRAVDHFNDRAFERRTDAPLASTESDEALLDRIRVNYLRHELTTYEEDLQNTAGKVGAADAYLDIKEKVLDAISDTYPELTLECLRQINKAYDNSL